MTLHLLPHGHEERPKERRRRKRHSSSKAQTQQPVAQNTYASQSTMTIQSQSYPPSAPVQIPQPTMPVQGNMAYPMSPPQHPVYGYQHQLQPQPSQQYLQPYDSPPTYPYQNANPSTLTFSTSNSPPQQRKNILKSSWNKTSHLASKSCSNLQQQLTSEASRSKAKLSTSIDASTNLISKKSTQALNQGAALCDLIAGKLDAVITSIDGERFSGREADLEVFENEPWVSYPSTTNLEPDAAALPKGRVGAAGVNQVYQASGGAEGKGSNHFSKVWLYANSRLPPHLPPFKVYMPTYPMICLAANYSERVYSRPKTSEVETHIPSDWRSGTKAMVLKSVPIDDMHTVVFAIRGSATFMDWAVNYRSEPSSPEGFLDDPGNLCHSGFLYVARKMIEPVASRLRTLLEENPSRSHCSLLITGHSAGGAVASLLYAHMMSTSPSASSDLNYLTSFFKRVHCITFGAPPVSLLPLKKPTDKRHRKSLFYSFINEGDPVPRADKQVVRSLLRLYASPAPNPNSPGICNSISKLSLGGANASSATVQTSSSRPSRTSKFSRKTNTNESMLSTAPSWNVPATTLSTAGRLIILRQKPGSNSSSRGGRGGNGNGYIREEDVEAVTVEDDILRTVVYGDPLKHMMDLYKVRVERLAVKAVTAGGV